MNCGSNAQVQVQLKNGEKVIFSCLANKTNRWMMREERILLLTNLGLHCLKKDEIQRKVHLSSIKALTKSTRTDLPFVVHVKSDYDYHFDSPHRKHLFDALKFVYYTEFNKNLPVYGVPDSSLKDYFTSKKDVENGLEVNP